MSSLSLSGKVALVTGANHGIGAATATALAKLGADVAITYLRTGDPDQSDDYNTARAADGSKAAESVEATGRRALTIEADLTDPDAPHRLFTQVEDELGPVSVLVHNASGWRKDTFAADESDAFGRVGGMVTGISVDAQLQVDARAADGVAANVVYPPVTDTGWITPEVEQFVANDFDRHHIAKPSEVAEVIGWLCSDAGRLVTGNIIRLR